MCMHVIKKWKQQYIEQPVNGELAKWTHCPLRGRYNGQMSNEESFVCIRRKNGEVATELNDVMKIRVRCCRCSKKNEV